MNRFIFIAALVLLWFGMCACESKDLSDPNTPFPAPTNLVSQKVSASSVKLSWTDNSKGEQGYLVEKSVLGSTDKSIFTFDENTSECVIDELNEQTYRFTVYAYFKQNKSESISINYQHTPLASATDLKITDMQSHVKLSWTLPSDDFSRIVVQKKHNQSAFVHWKTLDKTATEVLDEEIVAGNNTYRIFLETDKLQSMPAEASILFAALPQLKLTQLVSSSFMLSADVELLNDGGAPAVVGVCWSMSPNPTLANSQWSLSHRLTSGQTSIVNIEHLMKNSAYYVRAFASSSKGTSYSNELHCTLLDEPSPIQLQWSSVQLSNLPAEVKVFQTSSALNGRNFKAYYAIADMSKGNVELKTIFSSTAKSPSDFIASNPNEDFYVLANGGYFAYQGATAVSYSLVIDRAVKLADNIQALTRGSYVYQVTRGAFGVDNQQQASLKWVYGNYSYNRANPNVEGEIPLSEPSATWPETSTPWNAYTAIGGAPVLLYNGQVAFDLLKSAKGKYRSNYEMLQTDIFSESVRPPRTAIGRTADNKIVIFVCDGRQVHSEGATMLEMAQILKAIGCVDALNLDGGGSSAMVAGGQLLNRPSDGAERAVPSVVGFVKKKYGL